ncbi:hypothetical protein J4Q44_G00209370 [Coregonus suidteri]|uniref:Uncharacterized protein n=1 Tax=Coregonus suidteri TaxID=861788 RepID=A0AAN8LT69_9TELE
MSYWPPYTSTERCTRAVKRQEAPDETWGLFDVNIRYTRDTYEEARRKLPMAVVQSDLQTEDDDHPAYMKRKGRAYRLAVDRQFTLWAQRRIGRGVHVSSLRVSSLP